MAHYPNPFAAVRAAWLIERARRGSAELSHSELAEELQLGQATLNKYVRGSREPSFAELQRIIGRTDYRLEVRLRRETRVQDRLQSMMLPNPTPFAVSDLHLSQRLPAQLTPPTGRLPDSEKDGPRLEEALLHLYEIQDLARDARAVEGRLQQTYEQFHRERDRDLIHQMLSVGAGAGQAAAMLARAIDTRTTRPKARRATKSSSAQPRASRLLWAHIACCLRAEEAICRERVARQHRALESARQRRRAQVRLQDAELIARRSDDPATLIEVGIATAELDTATQRCAALSLHASAQDVGMAGERYLAVELTQIADRARGLFEELAAEPSFTAWRTQHAAADPLYDSWLDGELRSWFAPPRLYPNRDAFYRNQARLAQPWKERLERGDGGLAPFGSDERVAVDHLGQEWQITLAVPSALGDPRDWPTPDAAVVATRCPADVKGRPTPVYVLAQNVNARQAAAAINAASRAASLATIAVGLRAV